MAPDAARPAAARLARLGLLGALAASLARPAAGAAGRSAGAPLKEVIDLLTDLQAQVKAEGAKEASAYDEFACFCKQKTEGLSAAITQEQDVIDEQSAELEKKSVAKAARLEELVAKKAEQEKLAADLETDTIRCDKEHAEYAASNADFVKAVDSLKAAIKVLQDAKPGAAAGFLAVRQVVRQNLALAEAMRLVDEGPHWSRSLALMQEDSRVDPNDPDYKTHTQELIGILENLATSFVQKKTDANGEWEKTKAACEGSKASLSKELSLAGEAIDAAEGDLEKIATAIGSARVQVVEKEAQLKEDNTFLEDLTKMCEQRAVDWDQRAKMRGGELQAIAAALDILTNKVPVADLLQRPSPARAPADRSSPGAAARRAAAAAAAASPPSFLQRGALSRAAAASRGRRRESQELQLAVDASAQQQRVGRALELLRREGGRLGSTALAALALRVGDDPFEKVKTLIQELVERLLSEANAESVKNGFCGTQLAKAQQERDFRLQEVVSLSAALSSLEAKQDSLRAEIGDLIEEITALTEQLDEATRVRADEKSANEEEIAQSKQGLSAVVEATQVLKAFYTQAARAKVFLVQQSQEASSLAAKTVAGGQAPPEGAYQGKQDASSGVIGLLEVIQSNFESSIEATTSAEAAALAKFVEFDRASRADIAAKDTQKVTSEEDLETATQKVATGMADMKSNMDLVDLALKQLEELQPVCVDTGMSYQDRVAKRQEEVTALKRALCLLDTEGVEASCDSS